MIDRHIETRINATVLTARHFARPLLLAGTALLALSMPGTASAEQAATRQPGPPGQAQASGDVADRLHPVEQSLRHAQQQLAGGQEPNFAQARTAVQTGRETLGRLPRQAQGQEAFRTAQRELDEAHKALQSRQPDQQQVSMHMRDAADAVASLMRGMGGSAATGRTAGAKDATGSGAVINVQQQPRITVQQPAPQVTVQQQPPHVTVQQPPPQVTVNQPPPQVTVRQAQPQVDVERQGQPQVTVQQPGQPRVTVQRPGQAQATGEQPSSQATGQPATTAQSAGIPLLEAQTLIGTNVVGSNGRDAGEVENLLMDSSGRVRAAVIEWGGFIGLGEREALVPIERIQIGANEKAHLTMTREELEALPPYDSNRIADYGREHGWGDGLRLHR